MRRLSTLLTAGAVLASLVSGCSSDGDGPGDTGLAAALARVSPIEGENLSVSYDASAVLADLLADREPVYQPPRYEELIGVGSGSIAPNAPLLEPVGIDLWAAEYTITVGAPPTQYGLVSGGQDTETLTAELTENGWTADGDWLVAPDLNAVDGDFARFALSLAQVAASGSDVVHGSADADLSLVDGSNGSLADDERVSTVVACLGDVVAAMINTVELHDTTPMVGLGVRTPADADQRPQVVVCTSWDDADQAAAYADRATADLSDGTSLSGVPYSEIFDASDAVVDGDLASWETETDVAAALFSTWMQGGIPGMITSCGQLTPEQLATIEDAC